MEYIGHYKNSRCFEDEEVIFGIQNADTYTYIKYSYPFY